MKKYITGLTAIYPLVQIVILTTFCCSLVWGKPVVQREITASSLSNLPNSVWVDIRLKDDDSFRRRLLIKIDDKNVYFKYDSFDREAESMERERIFYVTTQDSIYSDLPFSESRLRKYETYSEFMYAEFDYVILRNYDKQYGKIELFSEREIGFRAERTGTDLRLQKQEICEWRLNGIVSKAESCAPVPSWLQVFSRQKMAKPMNTYLHSSGPINLLPQIGIGLMSSPSNILYGGFQIGASGPLITSGWYYAQLNLFLKINFAQWDYWRVFVGYGFSLRTGVVLSSVDCGCDSNDSEYFSGSLSANQTSGGHLITLGMNYDHISFEIGIELRQYSTNSVDFKSIGDKASNISAIALAEKKRQAIDGLSRFDMLSRFYYSVTYQIF